MVLITWALASIIYSSRDDSRRSEWWVRSYTRSILESQMGESMLLQSLILQTRQPFQKLIVCRVIAKLSHSIYRLDPELIQSISRPLKLESYLLQSARRSQGYKRAEHLALLCYLPLDVDMAQRTSQFANDRNRMVRLYTLITKIVSSKETIIKAIEGYSERFTSFELSQVVGLIRRGRIIVALRPLIHSSNANLQLLGLAIVKDFGLEANQHDVVELLATSNDGAIQAEAFATLCSLHQSVSHLTIRRYLASLSGYSRLEALRCMALEGYSERAISTITQPIEQVYFHSLIGLHKVQI